MSRPSVAREARNAGADGSRQGGEDDLITRSWRLLMGSKPDRVLGFETGQSIERLVSYSPPPGTTVSMRYDFGSR